jgi:hypothetical protein
VQSTGATKGGSLQFPVVWGARLMSYAREIEMRRLFTSLGALAGSALIVLGCGDRGAGDLFGERPEDSLGGRSGGGGRGGNGPAGLGGGGRGGASGQGGSVQEPGDAGQGGDAGGRCSLTADCDDENACTTDTCAAGICRHSPVSAGQDCGSVVDNACTNPDACDGEGTCLPNHEPAGTACGDATEDACTAPDACDGAGVCQPNHLAAGTPCGSAADAECTDPDSCNGAGACAPNDAVEGSPCVGGGCSVGACVVSCPSAPSATVTNLPFTTDWTSVGLTDLFDSAGCEDNADTSDFAVVFTPAADGRFRFAAAGVAGDDPESGVPGSQQLADTIITVVSGSCAGPTAEQLECDDDGGPDSDSQLELDLDQGQTVTVYVGEFHEAAPGGGSGTLTITQVDD